ncbi:PhoH family protein [Leuconostoc mesenteroides]|uniref:PhoH family protein n=1 Tax=Leuconostoc mesenteroides TaxID=1245 RepID=UPI0023609B8A|nr:PhoH family protein [Leuconostoc mesenteroides]
MSYVSLKEFIDVKEAGNLSQFLNYKKIFPKITHETDDFYHFAKMFYCTNKHLSDIDGWFLGTDLTVIPDFDILLFLDSFILNIDLKRQITNDDLTNYVSKKFKQQSRIFRVLNKTVYNLVFVVEDNSLYHFDPSTEIFSTYSFEDLFQLILSSNILFENKIEQLTPSEFLINPWKDKDDFIHQRYWLSNTQQKISDSIICSGIYGVTGEAGTGKTLIACDVMRKMSNDKRILFVVPGDVDSEKKRLGFKL